MKLLTVRQKHGSSFKDSLYPWSSRPLLVGSDGKSPLPRTGQSSSLITRDNVFYIFGGLSCDDDTLKGDTWAFKINSREGVTATPLIYRNQGPSPRVGQASLIVGNAFIGACCNWWVISANLLVFGGDNRLHKHDVLDSSLYLLNICK